MQAPIAKVSAASWNGGMRPVATVSAASSDHIRIAVRPISVACMEVFCPTTVFVTDARYDKMMEAFGGRGYYATSPDELKRMVDEAMDAGKPALINAVIDPEAGSESGNIGNLNPQSMVKKK